VLWLAVALALLSGGAACRTRDFDGSLALAQDLPYERSVLDSVWCERSFWRFWSKEDCVDWYRLRTTTPDQVDVTVSSRPESASGAPLLVTLVDRRGNTLDEARRASSHVRRLSWLPEVDGYYVAVRPSREVRDQCAYEIRAHQQEPIVEEVAPLPEIVCHKERRALLEVETAPGGARTVIVEQPLDGTRLSVGTRGRLVEDDTVVAEIEIVEAYDDGSRARIEESGGRTVSPRTEAEFETCVEEPR
jgi:hypothetical protein